MSETVVPTSCWGVAGRTTCDGDTGRARGDDVLRGGRGVDWLDGKRGDDRLYGNGAGDYLADTAGTNRLDGGIGADVLTSGSGNDAMEGGEGSDTASYVARGAGASHCADVTADLVAGTASGAPFGSDTLTGIENVATGGGDDVLIGDAGRNTFYVGFPCFDNPTPHESVAGGGGRDRISFDSERFDFISSPGPVEIDLGEGYAEQENQGDGPLVLITLDSIEDAVGTDERDLIIGSDVAEPPLRRSRLLRWRSRRGLSGVDIVRGPTAGTRSMAATDPTCSGRRGDDRLMEAPAVTQRRRQRAGRLPEPQPRSGRTEL